MKRQHQNYIYAHWQKTFKNTDQNKTGLFIVASTRYKNFNCNEKRLVN